MSHLIWATITLCMTHQQYQSLVVMTNPGGLATLFGLVLLFAKVPNVKLIIELCNNYFYFISL